ncbi:MAG TPA: fumarylacetoacetate hydrolase family protein [Actinomycetota bacterium]|nr:fumarylacetoacetate hydrolase family protein [Actinomycetota bacterium]
MRLVSLKDGRTARLDDDELTPLPGRLVDHLCRPEAKPAGPSFPYDPWLVAPPISRPGKIVGVGLNYEDHAAEGGREIPERPMLFSKFPTSVIATGEPIVMPPGEVRLDYEAELAVVIGAPAKNLTTDEAPRIIGGYACFNDVSERVAQQGDVQFQRGKSYDTFAPFGPIVATPDEVDAGELSVRCWVNDELRQDGNTARMVFSPAELVSFCSRAFSLEPGDVIATGTPAGVGLGSGKYLNPGDVVRIEIDGLGVLENPVAGPPESARDQREDAGRASGTPLDAERGHY